MESSFIKFKNITKLYHLGDAEIRALDGVSYSVNAGDFTVVAGPSGSGKSTFLNILGCIDKPTSGQLLFQERDITGIPLEDLNDLRLRQIGFIFQSFNLIPVLSTYENVELPLLFTSMKKDQIRERVEYVLQKVGLADRMHHLPANLSGGQRQRVAIARALAGNPSLIIADEPTASLDRKTSRSVIDLLSTLNEKDNVTVVLASHDPDIIERAKTKLHIQDGKLVKNEFVNQ